jgi:fatty acid synthase subunit alpha
MRPEATTLFFARFICFVADRVRATLEDTPEHAARLAILLRAVSHFTTTLLSDIDIHSLVASYEHEARKKVCPHSTWHAPSLWNMT